MTQWLLWTREVSYSTIYYVLKCLIYQLFIFSAANRMVTNDTDPSLYDALRDPYYASTTIIFYSFVILFGVIGNMLVVITLLSGEQTKTATDVFIASLAIVDILVSQIK